MENKKEVIELAKKRFQLGYEADSENRANAIEDMEFRAGNHWPEEIKNQRGLEGRPCLTVNKIPQNIHQITNEQRQNRPSIKVSPFDDYADVETAKILQGLIRSIENNSNADTAYDIGFDAAVTGGRGYVRVVTDYSSHDSFDQEVIIKSIHNPHNVVLDPYYREPDGSDANWAFCFEDITKDEFEELYPKSEAASDTFETSPDELGWYGDETIRIAEYFVKEMVKDKLIRLPDGSSALLSDIDEMSEEELHELDLSKEVIEELSKTEGAFRDTLVPKIMWYKINGNEILEETTWPSQWIPIVPIHGEELFVDGKRVFEGIVRQAKDAQRMYNYWATCETEAIALAPKAPWIGPEGAFEGHEDKWKTAHLKNYSYMEYKTTTLANGQPAPAPQRVYGEANVQAITQARMIASDDLKSTTGIYDASLGNRSNESSGVAITRRTHQAQTGNYHFVDNLSRSIRHLGKIIVDLVPVIYDSGRVVRILGEDDEESIIKINEIFEDDKGKQKQHDLTRGKYDVNVATGPSFSSKRQEAVEAMLMLSKHNPRVSEVAGDLIVKYMDWGGSEEVAQRLKKTIPPGIIEEDNEGQIPPEIQNQMQQMEQQIQELNSILQQAQEDLDDKQAERESKERIEMEKIRSKLVIEAAKIEAGNSVSDEDLPVLAKEILELRNQIELIKKTQTTGDQIPVITDLESMGEHAHE